MVDEVIRLVCLSIGAKTHAFLWLRAWAAFLNDAIPFGFYFYFLFFVLIMKMSYFF